MMKNIYILLCIVVVLGMAVEAKITCSKDSDCGDSKYCCWYEKCEGCDWVTKFNAMLALTVIATIVFIVDCALGCLLCARKSSPAST